MMTTKYAEIGCDNPEEPFAKNASTDSPSQVPSVNQGGLSFKTKAALTLVVGVLVLCAALPISRSKNEALVGNADALVTLDNSQCEDTAGWKNTGGYSCAAYASEGWCCGSGACAGKEWALGSDYKFPEKNCCACGKQASAPTCELGCSACGYNWYSKQWNNGQPTKHFGRYCGCCGGTQAQQDTCKYTCTGRPVPLPEATTDASTSVVVKTDVGGDWTSVQCDAGQEVIGGGCDAKFPPYVFSSSGPYADNKWRCGGHRGDKQAWAFCSASISPTIKEKTGGDWTTVQCDAGQKVIGGGCNAKSSPYKFQYNGPDGDDKWKCGGHGGAKQVWAYCSASIVPNIKTQEGGDWTTVQCDWGQKVMGGGCFAKGSPHIFRQSGPDGDDKWKCGGHRGGKQAWAICVPKAEKASCWSGRLQGTYVKEGHGESKECYDFDTAKEKCLEATDCFAIATQNNICGGKYRVTHGQPTLLSTLGTPHNWVSLHLWAYTLDRGCLDKKKAEKEASAKAAADADKEGFSLAGSSHRCVNRGGLHGSNAFSRKFQSPKACYEYMSGTAGCGKYFNFEKSGWCDCVVEAAGPCIQVPEPDSDVYKISRKACLDKRPNCATYKADGVCEAGHEDNHVWRTDCVKTCGYCDDPVYTAPCPAGYCGPSFAKEEDKYHLLTITSVKCIKPSSSMDPEAIYGLSAIAAIGVGVAAGVGCVGTGGAGCAATLPLLKTALSGGLAKAYVAAEAGGTAASYAKTALSMIDGHYSGKDDLIVKVNGLQVLPAKGVKCRGDDGFSHAGTMRSCEINAGETIEGKMAVSFRNTATIQLLEYDSGSDNDDLGWLLVDPHVTPHGMEQVLVLSKPEGTLYEISYTLELGGGDKSKISPFVVCGTVECRACDGPSCGENGGLDRDGDTEDLKKCPSSYIHDRYKRFPQIWPFADVFLNICKLDPARKLQLALDNGEVHA